MMKDAKSLKFKTTRRGILSWACAALMQWAHQCWQWNFCSYFITLATKRSTAETTRIATDFATQESGLQVSDNLRTKLKYTS